MEIADLQSFLEVVRLGSLQSAATALHQTPSALSKAIKRLEGSLGSPLFDRVGKTLKLNSAGERLRIRATELVRLAADMRAEFRGEDTELHCRIAAPAILQWRYGPGLVAHLADRYPRAAISFEREYEQDALLKVLRGDADFALVTKAAIDAGLPARLEARPLGSIVMQLACGPSHSLARSTNPPSRLVPVTSAQVLEHDFACPSHSPFCGIERGTRADGWRDDALPRRIRYWLDDIQVLVALVRSGRALAYLPDFALADERLVRLSVTDCPFRCVEEVMLAWQPATAHGWHGHVAGYEPMEMSGSQ